MMSPYRLLGARGPLNKGFMSGKRIARGERKTSNQKQPPSIDLAPGSLSILMWQNPFNRLKGSQTIRRGPVMLLQWTAWEFTKCSEQKSELLWWYLLSLKHFFISHLLYKVNTLSICALDQFKAINRNNLCIAWLYNIFMVGVSICLLIRQ